MLDPSDHLSQRFNFPLVAGLLAFGFLEQFEKKLHLVQGIPQIIDNMLDVLDRFPQGGGFRRPEGRTGWQRLWRAWCMGWRRRRVLPKCRRDLLGIVRLVFQLLRGLGKFPGVGMRGKNAFVVVAKRLRFRGVGNGRAGGRCVRHGFLCRGKRSPGFFVNFRGIR